MKIVVWLSMLLYNLVGIKIIYLSNLSTSPLLTDVIYIANAWKQTLLAICYQSDTESVLIKENDNTNVSHLLKFKV